MPTFRAGDLKDNQILGIVVTFEGAAAAARHNRCSADRSHVSRARCLQSFRRAGACSSSRLKIKLTP